MPATCSTRRCWIPASREATTPRAPTTASQLVDCLITNAVRCVPPENKPTPVEIGTCRPFPGQPPRGHAAVRAILALGRIAHDSTLAALGARRAAHPFKHGARHDMREHLVLFDSFHCSRYNTNTGRLTRQMFRDVFAAIRTHLQGA